VFASGTSDTAAWITCVAVCYSELQCAGVCTAGCLTCVGSALECIGVCCSVFH